MFWDWSFLDFEMKPPYHKETKRIGKQHQRHGNHHWKKHSPGIAIPIEKSKLSREDCAAADNAFPSTSQSVLPQGNTRIWETESSRFDQRKGIQGRNNSCYIDTLLFSLFYATRRFNHCLEGGSGDDDFARKTRGILKHKIVTPLQNPPHYCRADEVDVLRKHLAGKNFKVLSAFMATEDIVHLLFEQALKEPPFIKYTENLTSYMHIMLADVNDREKKNNIQNVFEFSMKANGDMRFGSVPYPALILGLPWHQERLFHYSSIAPVLELDISGFFDTVNCTYCTSPTVWEPVDKLNKFQETNPELTGFCMNCAIHVADSFKLVSRQKMRLLAVICYYGYHFTAVTRDCINDGKSQLVWDDNPKWLFFNSITPEGPKVIDLTASLLELVDNKSSNGAMTWNAAFENFHKMLNAHTCIYEPIFYDQINLHRK